MHHSWCRLDRPANPEVFLAPTAAFLACAAACPVLGIRDGTDRANQRGAIHRTHGNSIVHLQEACCLASASSLKRCAFLSTADCTSASCEQSCGSTVKKRFQGLGQGGFE